MAEKKFQPVYLKDHHEARKLSDVFWITTGALLVVAMIRSLL